MDVIPRVIGNTVQKRFRQVQVITNKIASVLSEKTGDTFQKGLDHLENIYNALNDNRDVQIIISSGRSDMETLEVRTQESIEEAMLLASPIRQKLVSP